MCETHRLAVLQLQQSYSPSVQQQLLQFNQKFQKEAQKALLLIIVSVKFLVRQGLACRAHKENEGNFRQLLNLRANECPQLKQFLSRKTNFCSWNTQNEILSMLSEKILQSLTQDVQKNKFYAVIMDGTQDNAGKEQHSVCIRYTTTNLEVEEVFVGLHEPVDTTGHSLSNMLLEILSGLCLSTENLQGQSYDGAANMAGIYNGCQAFIRNSQPLAEYFHCSAHCANLVARAINCELLRNFFVNLNELGVLIRRSIKFRDIIGQNSCFDHMIRPICLTRWLCRNEIIVRPIPIDITSARRNEWLEFI